MPAKILAIANQKGGVGKTTTTLTLGTSLARSHKRVLIVDLDPHACASLHLKLYPDEQQYTLHDLFLAPEELWAETWKKLITPAGENGVYVAPGSIRLSELEMDLLERKGKGMVLANALVHVVDEYDYILLDCPPHVGILLINALVAANLLLIPIQTDFLALHGLKLLFDTIRTINKVLPQPLRYKALPTMYDKRAKACTRVLELMRRKMQEAMFTTVIGVDTRFREASALGCSVYDIDPQTRGARAYDALAAEVMLLW
ncbi:MAG: ParA family protein [Desulfovibrionaceae bacterium]